jgi:hypothetical protein
LEAAQNVAEKLGLWQGGVAADALAPASTTEDIEEEYDEEDEDDEDEKMAAIGFLGKIRQYQKQLAKIQTVIGKTCDKLEGVQKSVESA